MINLNKYITIDTTFDSREEANKIIDQLLEKRLVACCQLSAIESSYQWQGKVEHTDEFLVQMKTKKSLYKEIESFILDNHSYETPELIVYDIVGGSDDYLNWIESETK